MEIRHLRYLVTFAEEQDVLRAVRLDVIRPFSTATTLALEGSITRENLLQAVFR
jgi:hypothetical protein